jgi:hypothetical protein
VAFVGREGELSRLVGALSGAARLVLVQMPPNNRSGAAQTTSQTAKELRHNGGSGLESGTGDHRAHRPDRLLDRCRGASLLLPALGFTAKLAD